MSTRITNSKGIATVTFNSIDDLPENVSVEILCRLPYKFLIRCKSVCRSWSTLISLPYFQTRRALYLRNHSDDTDQILVSVEVKHLGRDARELFTISKHTDRPLLKPLKIYPSSLIPSDIEMVVEATYNDLILFCEAHSSNKKYHICNPYTNQWFAVPPRYCFMHKGVGFICDPDYRCRIVQLYRIISGFRLWVEVFSSETGKWTEPDVTFPQQSLEFFNPKQSTPALAYDGMLYWLGDDGSLMGFDPFSKLDDNYHRRFISKPPPVDSYEYYTECLGVCRGSVRLCRLYSHPHWLALYVWELKEYDNDDSEVGGVGRKMMKWCLKERDVQLRRTGLSCRNSKLLALDPNDEDIIYLVRSTWSCSGYRDESIVVCSIRKMKEIDTPQKFARSVFQIEIKALPFVLPWWQCPTPLHTLDCRTST